MSDGSRADLYEKTERYCRMLRSALEHLRITQKGEDMKDAVEEFLAMASAYYQDGVYFREKGDWVNALVSFTYGHGWIDAGVRLGIFEVCVH
ncbi:MAG TPA: DUF357 domain-containing protein [Candidatus Syntrophoarchaeum butanivorans]|uniref:DUF357 domain-containing protein n=1 Tax=Candidatus Syntropharchaeum butanivorans TaxID=1839936 RepID=A0A1F2P6A1_9EURY|nr:MAG: hypothetical protein SBU_000021 [Candidatus Syntrophoarchaeum butanivorans]HEC57262.1 DUF357 domain-containing protein [Candidatus Syntrophoarchaeum butanivorans]